MAEAEMTRDDQLRINEFSRLNSRKAEQKKEVEKLQKSLQDLDDASEGVLLGDGNPGDVKIMHGESFFNIDADAANAYIDATKETTQAKLQATQADLAAIEARQRELKSLLYARLGDAINLEENPDQ